MPIYKDGKNKNAEGLQRYKVRVNYQDVMGANRQLTRVAYGLQQAKQLEMLLQTQQKEPESTQNVKQLYDQFIAAKSHEVRETTLDKLEQHFKNHILPELESVKLSKLTVPVLAKWKETINQKGLGIRIKKSLYAELKSLLSFGVKQGILSENPMAKLDNFRDAYETSKKDKLHYYTPEQFKTFITHSKRKAEETGDFRFYVFFMIAFYTGMRKGEINALKWSDIEGDVIHVRRSIAQKLKGEDRETPPKNKSSYRSIQIPQPLVEALQEQMARHQEQSQDISEKRVCGGDKCLRDSSVARYNSDIAQAADLPHITIHDYRHSHASLLANNAINIQEIARRLGHSKIEQTWNTYSHLYPQEEQRAIAILNTV